MEVHGHQHSDRIWYLKKKKKDEAPLGVHYNQIILYTQQHIPIMGKLFSHIGQIFFLPKAAGHE